MTFTELFTDPEYLMYGITLVLMIPVFLFGVIASIRVQTVFNTYNRVPCSTGVPAQGYVRAFLDSEGLHDVTIGAVRG